MEESTPMSAVPGRISRNIIGHVIALVAMAIGTSLCTSTHALGQAPASGLSLDSLLKMNSAELESLYRQGTVVEIPEGPIQGTALLSPGPRRTRVMSRGA